MKHIVTKKYLFSEAFDEQILKYLKSEDDYYNLAEIQHKNWNWRTANFKELGAWRWLCNYQFKFLICEYIFSDRKGIDFGGMYGPIYGNTTIVDNNVAFDGLIKYLKDVESNSIDYVFTSHTLEHVEDLEYELGEIYRILKPNGKIIVTVPSYTCTRWRAGETKSHKRTFTLKKKRFNWVRLDKVMEEIGFFLGICTYAWDNCIFIFGEKK